MKKPGELRAVFSGEIESRLALTVREQKSRRGVGRVQPEGISHECTVHVGINRNVQFSRQFPGLRVTGKKGSYVHGVFLDFMTFCFS